MENTPLPARLPDRGRRYIWLSMRTSHPRHLELRRPAERRQVVCPFALSLAVRMAHAQMGRATPLSAGHPRRLHEGAPDCARRDLPCSDPARGPRSRRPARSTRPAVTRPAVSACSGSAAPPRGPPSWRSRSPPAAAADRPPRCRRSSRRIRRPRPAPPPAGPGRPRHRPPPPAEVRPVGPAAHVERQGDVNRQRDDRPPGRPARRPVGPTATPSRREGNQGQAER